MLTIDSYSSNSINSFNHRSLDGIIPSMSDIQDLSRHIVRDQSGSLCIRTHEHSNQFININALYHLAMSLSNNTSTLNLESDLMMLKAKNLEYENKIDYLEDQIEKLLYLVETEQEVA